MSTHYTTAVNPAEFLYRLRASNGDLLYVGITTNWPQRMTQHQADKPWWSEVFGVELVRMDCTRQQIEAIEKAVIKTEAPRYNVVHNIPEGRVQLGARAKRAAVPVVEKRRFTPGVDLPRDGDPWMFCHTDNHGETVEFYRGQFVDTNYGRGAIKGWVFSGGPSHIVDVALSEGADVGISVFDLAEMNR